ncbi:hypothetical protein FACS189437_09610 [Bacteroidia bacterium]|nr:hypothetical protein FACS189437_09610 [Bacteroidia bacterium]
MKIDYSHITKSYQADGVKTFKEKDTVKSSKVQLLIEPKTASLLVNFQKRKFSRTWDASQQEESALSAFLKDSSKILEEFELEFDSHNIPYLVVNHPEIWKKWLYYADLLNSKYSGEWVEKEIGLITHQISDKNLFLKTLLNDFILNELYQREIYKIPFDNKTGICNRKWIEPALGVALEFNQECKLQIRQEEDTLRITGTVDLVKNKAEIKHLCIGRYFNPEDITSIEQKTVYTAQYITCIPNHINSVFSINGKNECLKQTEINISIKEIRKNE